MRSLLQIFCILKHDDPQGDASVGETEVATNSMVKYKNIFTTNEVIIFSIL